MATELRLRRGTTSEHENFTGAEAEVTVDTDKNTVVVHDGATEGGYPLVQGSTGTAADGVPRNADLRVDTLADLQALDTSGARSVQMLGRSSGGDGGAGLFVWDGSDLSTEVGNDEVTTGEGDGGIYIAPGSDKTGASGAWFRMFDGRRDARWYGVVADGSDHSGAFAVVLDSINADGGGVLFLPAGEFIVGDSDSDGICVSVPSLVAIEGAGKHLTTIKQDDSVDATNVVKLKDGSTDCSLSGLAIDANRSNNTGVNTNGFGGARNSKRWGLYRVEVINAAQTSIGTNPDDSLEDDETDGKGFAEEITLDQVSVRNGGWKNIRVRRSRFVTVNPGFIEGNPRSGSGDSTSAFETANAEDVTCVGSTAIQLSAPKGPGYRITNGSRRVTVQGTTVKSGRQNVIVIDSQDISITGVIGLDAFEGGDGAACQISNTDGDNVGRTTDSVLVSGCIFRNPRGRGASLRVDGSGTSLTNVVIRDNIIIDDGGGDLTAGLDAKDIVGGQTIEAFHSGNLISGQSGNQIDDLENWRPLHGSQLESTYARSVRLDDDTSHSIALPHTIPDGVVEVMVEGTPWALKAKYRATTTAEVSEAWNTYPTRVDTQTGALNGTTGNDDNVTVSVDSSGNFYIENRSGFTRRFIYTFSSTI